MVCSSPRTSARRRAPLRVEVGSCVVCVGHSEGCHADGSRKLLTVQLDRGNTMGLRREAKGVEKARGGPKGAEERREEEKSQRQRAGRGGGLWPSAGSR
jgi:hypothetical protein